MVLKRVSHLDHPSFLLPFSFSGLSVFAVSVFVVPCVFLAFFDYVQTLKLLLALGHIVPQTLNHGLLIGTSVEN